MNSNVNYLNTAPLLSEVPAAELDAIAGGFNDMFFNYKTLTGVVFADNGIFYMRGDGKWIQVTKT